MITSPVELKHALVSMWFSPFCRSSNQVDALSNDEPDVGDLPETQHVPDAAACSVLGSSGFEHVFMAEGRPHGGGFIGLHNWIFLYLGEFDEDINYLGHQAKASLPFKKGHLIEVNAVWKNLNKRSPSSIFVGASPEFELALFSLCFYARQDQHCPISLAGKRMNVTTDAVQDSEGKRLISTAFVVVPSWNNPG